MRTPLSQFLQIADPAILDRGRNYFKNGHVISFEEIQPGEYEAVVEGTEDYLSELYPAELVEIYEKGIRDYLKRVEGRNHYQEACRYMRRMTKLGTRKKVNELILSLRREYPKRKALLDELNKI